MTCASTSHLSNSYLLVELSELLIHRLGSPKCVVAGISVWSNNLFIKRIAKRKIRISLIPPPVTTAQTLPSRILAEKLTKNENSGLNVFLSGSAGRAYQLQDYSSCRMRYLHYPTLENTRSIKRYKLGLMWLFDNWPLKASTPYLALCIQKYMMYLVHFNPLWHFWSLTHFR